MKELERHIEENCSDVCQPSIVAEAPATLPDPEIPTIIPDTGVKNTKTDVYMTYLKKKSI